MKITCHLVVNQHGGVRITKAPPKTSSFDEIVVLLHLLVPDEIFRKPTITASITIPANAAQPSEIPVEVQMDARDAIERATGMKVELQVLAPEPPAGRQIPDERCEVEGCIGTATTIESGMWLCPDHKGMWEG